MALVCGVNSLFPSETLRPSVTLAPGSGKVFVPTLPLAPTDFPIDDAAAVMVAGGDVISLGKFYPARFFNDLPEYFQGLPLERIPGAPVLPEFADNPDSLEARYWGIQRIILRAIGREIARIDYILRGRVSLADYDTSRRLPHATPPDDQNLFELAVYEDDRTLLWADASFINPATVRFPSRVEQKIGASTLGSPVISGLPTTEGMYPGLEVTGPSIQGSTTADITALSASVTNIPSTVGYVEGLTVTGFGIPSGTHILSVDGPNSITLTKAATETLTSTEISVALKAVVVSVDSPTQVTLNSAARATDLSTPILFKYRRGERRFTNTEPAYATSPGSAGLYYVFARIINEQQTVRILGAAGGTFTLSFGYEETEALPYNAPASLIQSRLEQLSTIEPGDILVTDLGASHWHFTFAGAYRGTDVRQLGSSGVNLVGSAEIQHSIVVDGNSGFSLAVAASSVPPSGDHVLIGDASWNGTEWAAVETYTDLIGDISDGQAYYDPYRDPLANDSLNPACVPLSQNEGLASQLFAVTANWALSLWEEAFGLEVLSLDPLSGITYPERRSRILRAMLGSQASSAAQFSFLATSRARELGITIGGFEESQYTDPGWSDTDYEVDSLNEVAYLRVINASGGTFRLSADGGATYTSAISYNASAATVQSELVSLTQFAAGDVVVTGTPGSYTLSYGGQYEGVDMPSLTVDSASLSGLLPGALVTTTTAGSSPATNEKQRLTLTNVSGGTFTLTFDGKTTDPLSHGATATEVAQALDPSGFIRVTAIPGARYDFEFTGRLGARDVSAIVVNGTNLQGVSASVSQGITTADITLPTLWRGFQAAGSQPDYPLQGSAAESTYPYWIWCTVYAIRDLEADPAGAAARVATLRNYIQSMLPAHLQCGFDWGPIGGFITGISLVGVDRV